MSTTLLILASILPADAPPPISAEQRKITLAELIAHPWFGTWTREGQRDGGTYLKRGILILPMNPPAKFRLVIHKEEERGRFRGKVGDISIAGIWKFERGRLTLCWRDADKGFPQRFEEGEQQELLMLWPR